MTNEDLSDWTLGSMGSMHGYGQYIYLSETFVPHTLGVTFIEPCVSELEYYGFDYLA